MCDMKSCFPFVFAVNSWTAPTQEKEYTVVGDRCIHYFLKMLQNIREIHQFQP
jgi:hypothetical protein